MTRRFWIIFCDGEHLLSSFLKKGFKHCMVLMKDEFNWILFNPATGYSIITILPFGADENVPGMYAKKKDVTVLQIDIAHLNPRINRIPRVEVITCVSLVRQFLGIRVRGLTPYSFYKNILRCTFIKRMKLGINKIKILRR